MAISRLSAFMLSLLGRQYLLTGDNFLVQHPWSWLVWEPGEWAVPTAGEDTNTASTRLPTARHLDRPLSFDALCFELRPRPGVGFTLGRAEDNNIVLNDMTVSREHAQLTHEDGRWLVSLMGDAQGLRVGQKALAPGDQAALASGALLRVGGIELTYYDAAGFLERVRALAQRQRPG